MGAGSVGAGKTTLLDIIAQRIKRGSISGEVFLNGQPIGPSFVRITSYVTAACAPCCCFGVCLFARAYGCLLVLRPCAALSLTILPPNSYVDQDPSAIGTQTVREMLLTSARLRLPEIVTNEQKKERIQSLAVEFGIDHILDRRFGEVGPCAHRLMSPHVTTCLPAPALSTSLSSRHVLTHRPCCGARAKTRRSWDLWWRETPCADCVPARHRAVHRLSGRGAGPKSIRDRSRHP